jgi:SSS family solute:Na+ symporter
MASFMSGMAGNVTAFNTVWTYDLYQTYLVRNREDEHYLKVGRMATVIGTVLSIGSAYILLAFDNLMDYMQLLGAMFIAPFFIVFFLGMFWKRTTPTAAFLGIVVGVLGCAAQYIATRLGWLVFPTPMAATLSLAIWGGAAGVATTILVSLVTTPVPEQRLEGLVYGLTPKSPVPARAFYSTPGFFATVVIVLFVALNVIFR